MENREKPKVLKWSLIIAISILLNLFINYSLSLILKSPEYDKYCDTHPKKELRVEDPQSCIDNGGEWIQDSYPGDIEYVGYCDYYRTCSAEYDSARDSYERKIFISLISFGVIIFILSVILKLNYVLSVSLGIAAVIDFIIASTRYWSAADEILKLIILGLALVILVYISIKKFSDKS